MLVSTLLQWALFGKSVSDAFPYEYIFKICSIISKAVFSSGSNDEFITEINKVKDEAEKYKIEEKQLSDRALNFDESKFYIVLLILEKASSKNPESKLKIAQVINRIQDSSWDIQNELERLDSNLFKKKKSTRKRQNSDLSNNKINDVNSLFNKIVKAINLEDPSSEILEETIEKLKGLRNDKCSSLEVSQINLIYTLEDLLVSILTRDLSKLSEDKQKDINTNTIKKLKHMVKTLNLELSNTILKKDKVGVEKESLENEYRQIKREKEALIHENQNLLNDLGLYKKRNREADIFIHKKKSEVSNLKKQLREKDTFLNQNIQLNNQKIEKIKDLESKLDEKNKETNKLRKIYANIRPPMRFVGDLSKPKNKYHSTKECQYWRSLAYDYAFHTNPENIVSYNTPSIFLSKGISKCEYCSLNENNDFYSPQI